MRAAFRTAAVRATRLARRTCGREFLKTHGAIPVLVYFGEVLLGLFRTLLGARRGKKLFLGEIAVGVGVEFLEYFLRIGPGLATMAFRPLWMITALRRLCWFGSESQCGTGCQCE